MGHYTKLNCFINLKKDTPENVITFLKRIIIEGDLGFGDKVIFNTTDVFTPEFKHPFFECERWYMLFLSTNWSNSNRGSTMYKRGNYWTLEIDSEFKNYDNEINKFTDWIKPYIAGHKKNKYIGWYKPDTFNDRFYIHINQQESNPQ